MKKILFIMLSILFMYANALARPLGVLVTEPDGTPDGYAYQLKFTNGTVVLSDGVATITIAGVSPGDGTLSTIKEEDVQVGDADIATLDFLTGFSLVESPPTEINISLDVTPAAGYATLIVEQDALQVKYDSTDFTEGTNGLYLGASPTIATSILIGTDPGDTVGTVIGLPNAAIISFEDATETTITHVDNTGLLINTELEVDGTLDADGALELGDGGDTGTITTSDWTISATGAMTNIDSITTAGAITLNYDSLAYLSISTADGGATTISQTSDGTDQITIGDGSDRVDIASDTWDVTNGAISGVAGITVTTGNTITVGTTQWDDGSDAIDGERIADDTIDDDSIDFADITLNDFVSAEGDYIDVSADDIFDFTRNDDGVVTITASDVNSNADLTIVAGGTGALTIGNATNTDIDIVTDGLALTEAELAYIDIATLGTGVASKAVVLDGSGNYTAPAGTWDLSGVTAITLRAGEIVLADLDASVHAKDIVTTAPVTGATDNVLVGTDTDVTIALDFTASWDFGGAASLEIPSGTSGTTDATGEIYLDTDGDGGDFDGPVLQVSTNGATLGYAILLSALPSVDNVIIKYDAGTDTVGWEADQSAGAPTLDTVGSPEAAWTPSFDDTETVTLTTAQNTAGNFLTIDNTVADVTGQVYLLNLDYSVDDNQVLADYIIAQDAGGTVFTLQQNGDLTSTGNIAGATYGSDSSISDAELLTLDDGAVTEILVGGGAGSAPVWGADIPTAVTIGTAYIYRVGGTDVADADVVDDVTVTSTKKISTTLITEQLRLNYDATNYATWTVGDDGALTVATVDADAAEADINLNPDGLVGIKTAAPTVELDVTGSILASADTETLTLTLTGADHNPAAAGEIVYDNTITGIMSGGALRWYDDNSVRLIVDLETDPADDGYVVAYNATNDGFEMVASGGDITAVGPGFAAGAAFTDGVVSTGTSLFVWEGTTDDTVELIIAGPADPTTADTTLTLPEETGTFVVGPAGFGTDNILVKTDGTGNLTQATAITVDDSNNVGSVGTLGLAGDITMTSTSPDVLFVDSTTSGEAKIVVSDSAGPDAVMDLQVDVAGTLTTYIQLDGVNEVVDVTPTLVLAANPKIYDGDSHHLTIDAADLTADATIVFGSDVDTMHIENGTANLTWTGIGAISFNAVSKTLTISDNASINQDVLTTSDVTFNSINTGQGANLLYDMDQHVLTTSSPTFATVTASTGFALGDGDYVGITSNERFTFDAAGKIAAVGANFDIGTTSADDVQPALAIRGDADSDAGGDTDEALTIDLTPNATPTSALWEFTSTQSAGYTFDKEVTFKNNAAAATFGAVATNADVVLAFDAVTAQGSITYMEDEDRFDFDNDVSLRSDSAILSFGADGDVTITHVADTALTFNQDIRMPDNDGIVFGSDQDYDVFFSTGGGGGGGANGLNFIYLNPGTANTGDIYFNLVDTAADSTYTITNSNETYEANLSLEGDLSMGGDLTISKAVGLLDFSSATSATISASTTGIVLIADSLGLHSSTSSPVATAGSIKHDTDAGNFSGGALVWYNGSSNKYLVDLDSSPTDDDYVVAWDSAAHKFYMKVDETDPVGTSVTWNAIDDPDGTSEINFGSWVSELNVDDFRIGDGGTNYMQFSGARATATDDYTIELGTGRDWKFEYNETSGGTATTESDQLMLVTNNNGATAATDPMFQILVDFDTASGANVTSDQDVFGIAKGTQAANVDLFVVDEDGDFFVAGEWQAASATSDVVIQLADNAGAYKFEIQDSDGTGVFQIDSDGGLPIGGILDTVSWLDNTDQTKTMTFDLGTNLDTDDAVTVLIPDHGSDATSWTLAVKEYDNVFTADQTFTSITVGNSTLTSSGGITIQASTASSTQTFLGNNAATTWNAIMVRNNDEHSSTETGQAVNLTFGTNGTINDGGTYTSYVTGRIQGYKEGDYYATSAVYTDFDGGLKFYTNADNSVAVALTLASNKLATFAGNIVVPDASTIGSATTPAAITVASGGDLTVAGYVDAEVSITVKTDATSPVTVTGSSGTYFNNHASVVEYDLPAAASGKSFCFRNMVGNAITIDPDDSDYIIVGDDASSAAGEAWVSAGAAGEYMCLVGMTDAYWVSLQYSGTWAEESP